MRLLRQTLDDQCCFLGPQVGTQDSFGATMLLRDDHIESFWRSEATTWLMVARCWLACGKICTKKRPLDGSYRVWLDKRSSSCDLSSHFGPASFWRRHEKRSFVFWNLTMLQLSVPQDRGTFWNYCVWWSWLTSDLKLWGLTPPEYEALLPFWTLHVPLVTGRWIWKKCTPTHQFARAIESKHTRPLDPVVEPEHNDTICSCSRSEYTLIQFAATVLEVPHILERASSCYVNHSICILLQYSTWVTAKAFDRRI